MQDTSALYKSLLLSDNHWFETRIKIGNTYYGENYLMSLSTSHSLFNKNVPVVGSAVSGEIDISMLSPSATIPTMAKMSVEVRVTDGTQNSEWIPKGVYYIDTRQKSKNSNGLDILTIHGYDSMLMFEQDYPSDTSHTYPLLDKTMVSFMASAIGLSVDARTNTRMNKSYKFPLPVGYSCREMLSIIAASYGGNFIVTDENKLLLIKLGDLPPETNYLVDNLGNAIVFGGTRILV